MDRFCATFRYCWAFDANGGCTDEHNSKFEGIKFFDETLVLGICSTPAGPDYRGGASITMLCPENTYIRPNPNNSYCATPIAKMPIDKDKNNGPDSCSAGSGSGGAGPGDGKVITFKQITTNVNTDFFVSDKDVLLKPNKTVSGWQVTTADQAVEIYNANGKLISITLNNGLTTKLTYNTVGTGRLISITDPYNRNIVLSYDINNRIIQMKNSLSKLTKYTYDVNNNLSTVT
jgi:YD repeat-containing protein